MRETLCDRCDYVKVVVSGKGSRFLLCQRSLKDHRYPKYPPQPIIRCEGFAEKNV